jgi:hypothetical protein
MMLSVPNDAAGQFLITDFESGPSGWTFTQTTPTARWNIDSTPTLFVSPISTLNNADSTSNINESGSGEAVSPSAFLVGGTDKVLRFSCRTEIVSSQSAMSRTLRIGSGLPTGTTHVRLLMNATSTSADDPTPGSGEVVVSCSTGWHSHTVAATAASSVLVVDGVAVAGTSAQRNAIFNAATLNLVFYYSWTVTVSAPNTFYGVIVWLIDDLSITDSIADPFSGGGTGGGGGGGGSCSAAASAKASGLWASWACLAAAALSICAQKSVHADELFT